MAPWNYVAFLGADPTSTQVTKVITYCLEHNYPIPASFNMNRRGGGGMITPDVFCYRFTDETPFPACSFWRLVYLVVSRNAAADRRRRHVLKDLNNRILFKRYLGIPDGVTPGHFFKGMPTGMVCQKVNRALDELGWCHQQDWSPI